MSRITTCNTTTYITRTSRRRSNRTSRRRFRKQCRRCRTTITRHRRRVPCRRWPAPESKPRRQQRRPRPRPWPLLLRWPASASAPPVSTSRSTSALISLVYPSRPPLRGPQLPPTRPGNTPWWIPWVRALIALGLSIKWCFSQLWFEDSPTHVGSKSTKENKKLRPSFYAYFDHMFLGVYSIGRSTVWIASRRSAVRHWSTWSTVSSNSSSTTTTTTTTAARPF